MSTTTEMTAFTLKPIVFQITNFAGWTLDFDLLFIELGRFEGALFGVWIRKNRFTIDVLFIRFEISKPWI